MKRRGFVFVLGLALASIVAIAAPPGKDSLDVVAQTSGGGVHPTVPGNAPNQWFYAYCLPSGSALNDTFPLSFTMTNSNGVTPESVTVSLNATGSPALTSGTSPPGDFQLADDGTPVQQTTSVSTGVLNDGNYDLNIQVSSTPANAVTITHGTVHVHVTVGASCTTPVATCFLTSSEFTFLQDCAGAEVTGSTGGTFSIVPNAKNKVVATNPGQFYYNLVWTNTGSTQPVTISLGASGLVPTGANAVHALVFNASGFTTDASAFDMVNQDGTPCGPSGPCTVTVPAGEVLWVTWHLQYAGIGGSTTNMSNACPGNVAISAGGTLKDGSGATLATCGTSASGYLKK